MRRFESFLRLKTYRGIEQPGPAHQAHNLKVVWFKSHSRNSLKNKEKHRLRQKEWYQKNKTQVKAASKIARSKIRTAINELKNAPCTDCNKSYPFYVMDFDHVRGKKEFDISDLTRVASNWNKIISEVNKCELVCANCHRERTFNRNATTI